MLAALKAQRDARASEIRTGQIVASTSANSHAVAFSAPEQVGITPYDLFTFWQEMVDLFNSCTADLTAAGETSITDDDVLEEMLFVLDEAKSYGMTYTGVAP